MTMMTTALMSQHTDVPYRVAAKIDNPMAGIAPNFYAFGVEFDTVGKRLLSIVWVLVPIAILWQLIRSSVRAYTAGANDPRTVKKSRAAMVHASRALAVCVAMPVILGAILGIAG